MNIFLMTNIDPIRAEVMRLENTDVFDQAAWDCVLGALYEQGRLCALADAAQRMETGRANATYFALDVAVETEA